MGERSTNALRDLHPAPPAAPGKRASTPKPAASKDAALSSFTALTAKLDYLDAGELKRVREA